MICLSSAAVVRLAKAKVEMEEAEEAYFSNRKSMSEDESEAAYRRMNSSDYAFKAAAMALANEAIAMGHHTREGD